MTEIKYLRLNGDAVSAILENRKSQMRFALKSQDIDECSSDCCDLPYEVGDIIGVKETWAEIDGRIAYRVDDEMPEGWHMTAWNSSTRLPKEHVRLFLEVVNVRVERLQDISLNDIVCEGIWLLGTLMPEVTFAGGWDDSMSERKRNKYGWRSNPWVEVVEFKRKEVRDAISK